MNLWHYLKLSLILVISLVGNLVAAQCSQVSLKPFTDIELTSIKVNELELAESIAWQVQYWPKYQPSNSIISDSLFINYFVMNNLLPSTIYEIWVRNICDDGFSEWNGPFFEKTIIPSSSDCGLNLDIPDNSCPVGENFLIAVDGYENEILGDDVFLAYVKLIVSHDWPADLRVSLISPDGVEVALSRDIGINKDNYGDPDDVTCQRVLRYDMAACNHINQIDESMTGSYIPIGDFSDFHTGNSPNGIWNLKICDKATGDIGQLKYVKLKFSSIICEVPTDIGITSLSDTSFTINWETGFTPNSECAVVIEYGPKGFIPGTENNIGINCDTTKYTINGLEPDTEYDFVLFTDCISSNSPLSCRTTIRTNCSSASLVTNFDDNTICDPSCTTSCTIYDEIWHNDNTIDDMDWLVNNNTTPSEQTGPKSDISLTGNYIYIENNNTLCPIGSKAILTSSCMMVKANNNSCDMDFYYHMLGDDISTLELLISTNNQQNWDTLFTETGAQGADWNRVTIDLSNYHDHAVIFRFIATSGIGEMGDIALDNISFYGTKRLQSSLIFYADTDNDGYGNPDMTTSHCDINPPPGYVNNADDCNDSNMMIHPGATEIHCNLIDENCNGNQDDQPLENPIDYTITNSRNVNCNGYSNGLIEITASGGIPPYQYLWNNGVDSNYIDNLNTGIYFCTITDNDGCMFTTKPIHLSVALEFYPNFNVETPTCIGVSDGNIQLSHSGISPFEYLWSTGETTKNIENVEAGIYWVEISSEFNGFICSERDTILVEAPQKVQYAQDITNISCKGNTDGAIELIPLAGQSPFSYHWSDGRTSSIVDQLAPGIHKCTITDANGCKNNIDSIVVQEPDSLIINIGELNHVVCNGQYNGIIMINPNGGTSPYTYLWNNESQSKKIDSLPAGNYSVSITDINGCTAFLDDIKVLESPPLVISLDSLHGVSCPLSYDGFLSVDVSGGAGDYQYFWKKTDLDTNALEQLPASNYSLRVVDAFGCKVPFESEVPLLNIPLDVTTSLYETNKCYGDTIAGINTIVNSGTAPYTYHWSNGRIQESNENIDSIKYLVADNYKLTITDSEGCIGISEDIEIQNLQPLNYTLVSWSNPNCYNEENGFIEINGIGGSSPYSYEWNNEDTGKKIESLGAGEYWATITDINDCSIETNSLELLDPEAMTIDINIDYNSISKKSIISIQPTTGEPPFIFVWSDMYQDTGYISIRYQLELKEYNITITDNQGCTIDTTITIDDILADNSYSSAINVNIFPNPNNGNFQLHMQELSINKEYDIEIVNLLGQTIYTKKFKNESESFFIPIKIPANQNGCLFLSIYDDKRQLKYVERIILE